MASVTITKDMTIGELLDINQGLAPVLNGWRYATASAARLLRWRRWRRLLLCMTLRLICCWPG